MYIQTANGLTDAQGRPVSLPPAVRTNDTVPRYQHDSTCCTYLGGCVYDGQHYDLYYCAQGGMMPTVLARFSGHGPDYMSGWSSLLPPLVLAREMAREQGCSE